MESEKAGLTEAGSRVVAAGAAGGGGAGAAGGGKWEEAVQLCEVSVMQGEF